MLMRSPSLAVDLDVLSMSVVAVVRAQVVEMVPTVRQTRLAVLVESARLRI